MYGVVCRNDGLRPIIFGTGAWRDAMSIPRRIAEYLGTKNVRVNSYIWLVVNAVFHRSRRGKMESEAVCSPGVGTNKK